MQISQTKIDRAPIILIYGDHKIGKSTFASGSPSPVFIATEDGLQTLGVQAFPLAKSWSDVLAACDQILTEKHAYKTLVIDSLDWAERLLWLDLCNRNNWDQIGDGPYGAGYKLALKEWDKLLKLLFRINREKKMLIILVAHAKIQKFEDPERENNYDRYDLDLHEKSGNMICQAMDVIGFAGTRVVTQAKQEGLKKVVKAKMMDERVLNLEKSAAYEAGNRYGLPAQIPLSWDALALELKAKMINKNGNLNVEIKGEKPNKKKIEIISQSGLTETSENLI